MKRTPVPPGQNKVYELNICQTIHDHVKCPPSPRSAAADSSLGPSPATATVTKSHHSRTDIVRSSWNVSCALPFVSREFCF
jgi:hypothetical protein